ncbi:uncharacterized protein LOC115599737 [Calypte anna]|uniref:uncharacterized protein LOC115599737 n=1 Tax=Calypte anna TaxID=9244 RepID=UPI0011C3A769|nr:uncharacterized protein LOC115599737 [Calypte anna]
MAPPRPAPPPLPVPAGNGPSPAVLNVEPGPVPGSVSPRALLDTIVLRARLGPAGSARGFSALSLTVSAALGFWGSLGRRCRDPRQGVPAGQGLDPGARGCRIAAGRCGAGRLGRAGPGFPAAAPGRKRLLEAAFLPQGPGGGSERPRVLLQLGLISALRTGAGRCPGSFGVRGTVSRLGAAGDGRPLRDDRGIGSEPASARSPASLPGPHLVVRLVSPGGEPASPRPSRALARERAGRAGTGQEPGTAPVCRQLKDATELRFLGCCSCLCSSGIRAASSPASCSPPLGPVPSAMHSSAWEEEASPVCWDHPACELEPAGHRGCAWLCSPGTLCPLAAGTASMKTLRRTVRPWCHCPTVALAPAAMASLWWGSLLLAEVVSAPSGDRALPSHSPWVLLALTAPSVLPGHDLDHQRFWGSWPTARTPTRTGSPSTAESLSVPPSQPPPRAEAAAGSRSAGPC